MSRGSGWQRHIRRFATEEGLPLKVGDARRVEAFARVGNGTLDRLGRQGLVRETRMWLLSVEDGQTTREEWDRIADSYGL